MATLSVIKFKGLTDLTGNSFYLGSGVSNLFQSAQTPYEATYQINFNNDIVTAITFFPTQAVLSSLVNGDGLSYAGKYKISNIRCSLNQNITVSYDTVLIAACNANSTSYLPNIPANDMSNFNVALPTPSLLIPGGESPIQFNILSNNTTGFIRFTINYFDKYIVQSL